MSESKERISFSIPTAMKEKIEKLGRKDNRKLTTYMKKVLDAHIKQLVIKKRS